MSTSAHQEGPVRVLFICTANACRSQMGEHLARAVYGDAIVAASAGVKPGSAVDPNGIAVIGELGISMAGAHNKHVAAVALPDGLKYDLAVTVCSNAAGDCPTYSGTKKLVHAPFDDPPVLAREAAAAAAAAGGSDPVDPLPYYRRVRDEILAWVTTELPKRLPQLQGKQRQLLPSELKAGASGASNSSGGDGKDNGGNGGAAAAITVLGSPSSASVASPSAVPDTPTPAVDDAAASRQQLLADTGDKPKTQISFFERYLTLWVLLCMIAGALIGYYAPVVPEALEKAQFANINAIVAVLLWIMITPMLVQIDFASLWAVKDAPGAIALTTGINYLVKPFTMYALAALFFKGGMIYSTVIPDSDLRNSYIAGLVLLGGAPCTAMVFVWSLLVGGSGSYTLVQVAFNDLLMLALYVPTCAALIGATSIPMPWDTIAIAVALFIVAPLVLAAAIRAAVLRHPSGKAALDSAINAFKPVTIVALLATLVLIFIFQGPTIGAKPLHIVLLAIPITIQTVLNFCIAYGFGYSACMPHERLAPAAMIATSNFFELAVAAAISIYGLGSGAALATVVGVLVEVPVMLALVSVCNWLRPTLEKRIEACDEMCGWAKKAAPCCSGGRCGAAAATTASTPAAGALA